MRYMKTQTLYRLFLVSLVIVISGFIVVSTATRVESQFNPVQQDAPTAIATACAGAIEACGRNPSICGIGSNPSSTLLLDLYNESVADILALNVEESPNDLALAKGIISAALVLGVGRNPGAESGLRDLAAMCIEDIESL